ncbi:2-C-methyl-D-erythritol 4-phosphate cytidylyltransferase [candidate division WOR-3 bacterium]|uniref:2-C-methyl-D-erythritol 4-phosphate cytidylyltransferase n=1 Tax=candidate division WOR-3 bacterium TaxID=2052148 RepID=A0A660SDV1_UNCW3|nr:MAG: 2-C-methyl-D-erythritol 4-phosphate cytidylyltransferase [candidate division WOR-3 bacterium]
MARIEALVPAAGSGERFGGFKQFYEIKGLPILIHTLKQIDGIDAINRVVVVAPPGERSRVERLIDRFGIRKVKAVVKGGRRRIDSVRAGLAEIRARMVIIHDAVRPLASKRLFKRVIRRMATDPAVIPILPVRDTIKEVRRGWVIRTLPREGLFLVQTPQGFWTKVLREALRRAPDIDYTDEAAVLESTGVGVRTVAGELANLKVTEQKDIQLLLRLL